MGVGLVFIPDISLQEKLKIHLWEVITVKINPSSIPFRLKGTREILRAQRDSFSVKTRPTFEVTTFEKSNPDAGGRHLSSDSPSQNRQIWAKLCWRYYGGFATVATATTTTELEDHLLLLLVVLSERVRPCHFLEPTYLPT